MKKMIYIKKFDYAELKKEGILYEYDFGYFIANLIDDDSFMFKAYPDICGYVRGKKVYAFVKENDIIHYKTGELEFTEDGKAILKIFE